MPMEGLPQVDIILPVFNQPDWTRRCLTSIFERTTDVDFRVIAIDDGSTNAEIPALLQEFAQIHPEKMLLLPNPQNRGFVRTVNRGLRYSERDVVILNTDTEVSTGWLTRMARVACSDPRIASVTPLSTEASIYSVFQSPTERSYAKNMGTEAVASLVKRHSENCMPEIPTAVGFCMYIKRSAINAIGTFDTAFGRGYGEENDWCMRAAQSGWKHVLDDSTFIYHEGHVTMRSIGYLGATQTSIPEHERILRDRYPDFDARITAFLEKDTVLPAIRTQLVRGVMQHLARNRRRIAFIVHGKPSEDALGGTELHVYDLIQEMRQHSDILVLYPEGNVLRTHRFVAELEDCWAQTMDVEDAQSTVAAVLKQFSPDVVHVHHMLDLGFAILQAAKQSGARVVYSIHDYYAISPQYTLTDEQGMFEGIPKREKAFRDHQGTYGAWQDNARLGLQNADAIVAPSSSALSIFDAVFKDITSLRRVLPHGIPGNGYSACGDIQSPPTVCFLGYVHAPQKGRTIVESVIRELAHAGVRCVLLGSSAEHFPALRSPLIQFLGEYKRYNLPSILRHVRPHAVAILSTYPETFCYALSESWQAGIPAYVAGSGALLERMEETNAGWVAPSQDPKEICGDILQNISGGRYCKALMQTQLVRLRTRQEMAESYGELYDELCAHSLPVIAPDDGQERGSLAAFRYNSVLSVTADA